MMRSWGHRERLKALCGLGVGLAVAGTVATVAGASGGPGLAVAGVVLGCWEAVGLWLGRVYAAGSAGGSERGAQSRMP
ncbi:MAG: hypothetical protein QOF84_3131 [Streptomyces sp.]|nr:hypothetical protein [Streptomyces sp.]MDX6348341.1 hypothetical protein [Streptomyces sp.]